MYIKKLGKRMVATILAVLLLLSMSSEVFAEDIGTNMGGESPGSTPSSTTTTTSISGMSHARPDYPYGYRVSIVDSEGNMGINTEDNNAPFDVKDIFITSSSAYLFCTTCQRTVSSSTCASCGSNTLHIEGSREDNTSKRISVNNGSDIKNKFEWIDYIENNLDNWQGTVKRYDVTGIPNYKDNTYMTDAGWTPKLPTSTTQDDNIEGYQNVSLETYLKKAGVFNSLLSNVWGINAAYLSQRNYNVIFEPIYRVSIGGVLICGTVTDIAVYYASAFKELWGTYSGYFRGDGYTGNLNSKLVEGRPDLITHIREYAFIRFPNSLVLADAQFIFTKGTNKLGLLGWEWAASGNYYAPSMEEIIKGPYGIGAAFTSSSDVEVDLAVDVVVSENSVYSGDTTTATYIFSNIGENDAIVNISYGNNTENNIPLKVGETIERIETVTHKNVAEDTDWYAYIGSINPAVGYREIEGWDNYMEGYVAVYPYDLVSSFSVRINNDVYDDFSDWLDVDNIDNLGKYLPDKKVRVEYMIYNQNAQNIDMNIGYSYIDANGEKQTEYILLNEDNYYEYYFYFDTTIENVYKIDLYSDVWKVDKNQERIPNEYEDNSENNMCTSAVIVQKIDLTTEIKFFDKYDCEISNLSSIKSGDKVTVRYYYLSDVGNIKFNADIFGTSYNGDKLSDNVDITFGELNDKGVAYSIDYYFEESFIVSNDSDLIISKSFEGKINVHGFTYIHPTVNMTMPHAWYEFDESNNSSFTSITVHPVDLSVTFKVYAIQEENGVLKYVEVDNLSDDLDSYINGNGTEVPLKKVRVVYTFSNNSELDIEALVKYGLSNSPIVEDKIIKANGVVTYTVDYGVDEIRNLDGSHNKVLAVIQMKDYSDSDNPYQYEQNKENNELIKFLRVIPIDLVTEIIVKVNGEKVDIADYEFDFSNFTADGKNLEIKSGDKIDIVYAFSHNFEYEITADLQFYDYDENYTGDPFVLISENGVEIKAGERKEYACSFIVKYVGEEELISDTIKGNGVVKGVAYENVWYESDLSNNFNEITTEIYNVDLISKEIKVYDENGNEIEGKIQEGSNVYVEYTFENNCELEASVVIRYDKNSEGLVEEIRRVLMPNETITLRTDVFVVKAALEETALNVHSEVFMDNHDNDASYELNNTNNIFEFSREVTSPFSAKLQTPNSEYRRDVEVVTSFVVKNTTKFDYNGVINPYTGYAFTNRLFARFELYTDVNKTNLYDYIDCEFVAPSEEETLVWFKWRTPVKADIPKVYGTLTVDFNNVYSSTEYKNNGNNSKVLNVEFDIAETVVVNTPDTKFTGETPYWYGYSKAELEAGADRTKSLQTDKITPTLSWSYWDYSVHSKEFTKVTETASLLNSKITITPENCSAYLNQYSEWIIKSGYGFTLKTDFQNPNKKYESCTPIQTAYCTFPEFGYRTATQNETDIGGHYASYYFGNSYRDSTFGFDSMYDEDHNMLYPRSGGEYGTYATLVRVNEAGQFELPVNDTIDKNKHYIPIWQPDGLYTVIAYYSDAWTPGGMLSGTDISNNMYVHGTMYDDLYFISY